MDNPILAAISMISQGALYPVIIVLILMLVATVVLLVTTIVEYFTERRQFKVSVPQFIREIEESDCQGIPSTIAASELMKRQKVALMQLFNSRDLPQEARWNVAKRAVYECGEHYRRREALAEVMAKVAPMVGLMGTIIPLGPGLQALSGGQIGDLASALIVAFDTTVLGLISAAVCLLIARVRNRWNEDYANAMDSMAGALFDKLADLEEAGDLSYEPPACQLEPDDEAAEKKAAKEKERAEKKEAREKEKAAREQERAQQAAQKAAAKAEKAAADAAAKAQAAAEVTGEAPDAQDR